MRLLVHGTLLTVFALVTACSGGGEPPRPSTGQAVAPVDRTSLMTAVATTLRIAPNHVTYAATLRKGSSQPHWQTVDAHRGRAGGEQIVFRTDGVRADLRRLGGTAWLRSGQPAFTKVLPAGKPWVQISASQAIAAGLPSIDELVDLLYVSRAAGRISDKGMTSTDHVAARTASFAIDLGKAVCLAPEDSRLDIATLMNSDPRLGRSVSVQVWLDAFHLVRRMVVRARAGGLTADYDVRVRGDDTAVPVFAPPDAETVEVADVPDLDRVMSVPRPAAPRC